MRKIVFFDIDGTLVDDATQILPDSAGRAVEALRERGHLAVLNTGRPRSHIDPRLLTWTWDGCISGCGMEVQAGGRTLHRVLPEAAVCRRMRDLIRACRLDVLFEVSGGLILDGTRPQGPQVRLEADRMRAKGFPSRKTGQGRTSALKNLSSSIRMGETWPGSSRRQAAISPSSTGAAA